MGWSQELNDFSEGFGSGFQMVRSRDEREADKLANERRRQEVEQFDYEKSRRPVLEGREQKLYDLDVQRQEGVIDQQEWEKQRRVIEAGHEDELHGLGVRVQEGVLEEQEHNVERRPELEGREKQLHDLDVLYKEGAIDQQEWEKQRRVIEAGQTDETHEVTIESARLKLALDKEAMKLENVKAREAVAEAERLKAIADQKQAIADADPTNIKKAQDAKDAVTRLNNANAAGQELQNQKLQDQQDMLKAYQKKRGQRGTLTDENEVPAAPTPGPQSQAVPVEQPVSSMSTTEAQAPVAEEGVPVETARPLVQTAGLYIGGEPPPEEAVPAEPVTPAAPATPAYGVPLPEGGPRAHPHVDRIQRSRAEQENTPARKRLDDATVNVLEAAGAQTNTRAVVTSGGTGGEPAQVRLYDMETNKPLDPNNPDDRQRMQAFNAAVQSAPSEITTTTSPLDHTGSVYKVAREAAMVGLDNAADKLGVKNQGAVDTPEYEQAARSFLLGEYGAGVDQVEQAKAVVQEIAAEAGHELNEAEEAVHTIAYAYDSYMAAGMYAEAKEAATALVGHYTTLAGQFSAVAKAAVMEGDLPAALEAAARAYANVPDGVGVDFNRTADGKYEVIMTNEETGEVTTRSILTPAEVGGLIMKIDPSHFLSTISQAAGKDLEETLSAEAAEQMGRPELAGLPRTEVGTIQAEEKEKRLRGGGAVGVERGDEAGGGVVGTGEGFGKLSQSDLSDIADDVTKGFERFAASSGSKEAKYTTDLDPESNSDLLMQVRPIAEQIAIDNFGTLRPDLAASAVMRMIDQEPVSVKPAKGGGFEVKLKGMDPFTISDGLYERLTDARVKYSGVTEDEQASYRNPRALRRDLQKFPYLTPGDTGRNRVVPAFTPGGAEAVPTEVPRGRTGQPIPGLETPVTRQGGRVVEPPTATPYVRRPLNLNPPGRRIIGQ